MTSSLRLVDANAPAIDGAELLDNITAFVSRFIVFPHEHCAPMLALWYAHTHAAEHFYITPRLVVSSAEPGSGKTLVIEVGQYLVAKPEMVIMASAASVFRMIGSNGPVTLLWDEVDTIFTGKGGDNEELRGILNGGYKRTAYVPRCVGEAHNVQKFPVFSPTALIGLAGGMPPTITNRAITIHMRRKKYTDQAEEFREKKVMRDAAPLRDALGAWIGGIGESLGEAEPEMPPGVISRAREIWEPLLAIADAAGGEWPETARRACAYFVREAGQEPISTGTQLLTDLNTLFTRNQTDRMATTDILTELWAMDESPWQESNGGRPLDAGRLARELARYHVRPGPVWINGQTIKGYVTYETKQQVGLSDAWSRYLSPGENQGDE